LAVKRIKDSEDEEAVIAEVCVLDRCRSNPHFVNLVDVFKDTSGFALVFEDGGLSLRDVIAKDAAKPDQIRVVVANINSALAHMHSIDLIHWRCSLRTSS
jgi:serine/threonine protein kinase